MRKERMSKDEKHAVTKIVDGFTAWVVSVGRAIRLDGADAIVELKSAQASAHMIVDGIEEISSLP